MKFLLKFVNISILLILFSAFANAQIKYDGEPPNRILRRQQALEWINCFSKLEKQIPTLSPAEKKWLENEMGTALGGGELTRRAFNAMFSREHEIYVARSYLPGIIHILIQLAGDEPIEKSKEIKVWAQLANQFIDAVFWESISNMVGRGVIESDVCGIKELYLVNFARKAQALIKNIIINYLNGSLP